VKSFSRAPLILGRTAIDPATGKCAKVCDCKSALWPRISPDGQTLEDAAEVLVLVRASRNDRCGGATRRPGARAQQDETALRFAVTERRS
jgi:hypothetical protein